MPVAVSMQLPQLEPQPVRIINSGMESQPAAAASRISLSVIPWQRQTYKARTGWGPGAFWPQSRMIVNSGR